MNDTTLCPQPIFPVGTPVRFVNQLTLGGIVTETSWSTTYEEYLYRVDTGAKTSLAVAKDLESLDA